MKCSECPNPIPESRQARWPQARTCSMVCAALRGNRKRREANANLRRKRREALKGATK